GDANHRGPAQVLTDGRSADPDRSRNLALTHARAWRNLRTSRTLRIGALSAGIGSPLAWSQRETASAIRSPTARASHRLHSMAGFDRNGWPTSVGICGRLASDYAAQAQAEATKEAQRAGILHAQENYDGTRCRGRKPSFDW